MLVLLIRGCGPQGKEARLFTMLLLIALATFSRLLLAQGAAIELQESSADENATAVPNNVNLCQVFDPCLNGGRCIHHFATGRSCICTPGFTGSRCQFVDFCASSPCASTATCLTEKTKYTCVCAPGYVGSECDVVDPCLNKTCNNGGTCIAEGSTARCDCPGAFAGHDCNTQCAPSNHHRCYGNGRDCVLYSSGYVSCSCSSRVPRDTISCVMQEDLVNECSSFPRVCNGGQCHDLNKGFYCSRCPSGRSGDRCEVYNPCYSSPCRNGGTCIVEGDEYTCKCPSRYQGMNCQWRNDSEICSLTCTPTTFQISCSNNEFPSITRSATLHARLSDRDECFCRNRYSPSRRCTIPFDGCGTKTKVSSNGTLVYHNFLTYNTIPLLETEHQDGWELDLPITRSRGDFRIDFECEVPTRFTATSQASSKDFVPNNDFKIDVANRIRSTTLTVSYFTLFNNTLLQFASSFNVGRRLYALVKVNTNYDSNAELQNSKLKLGNCYATPTSDANSVKRYQLLQDGCVKDKTFRFETKHLTAGDMRFESSQLQSVKFKSLISFLPFTFKHLGNRMFLHCTGYLCENGACNQCREQPPPRKRRLAALETVSNPSRAIDGQSSD